MVDERRARELLGDAGRDVPVGGAPVDALVRRGRRSLWHRRAAPVLAVAVVAGVVVGGDGLFSGVGDDPEPARSDPGLVLNVGDWEPGDDAMAAQVVGSVAVDRDGCVHLTSDRRRYDVVWPEGTTAARAEDGRALLSNSDGELVAVQDERISTGGGYIPRELECHVRGAQEVAVINDELEPVEEPQTDLVLNTVAAPSDGSRSARIVAYLEVAADGCVHLRSGPTGSTVVDAVFPFGFYADEQDGDVIVRRPGGAVVAREGQRFESAGSLASPAPDDMRCRVSSGVVISPQAMQPLPEEPDATTTDPEPTAEDKALVRSLELIGGPFLPLFTPPNPVVLGLGEAVQKTVPGDELPDPDVWVFDEPFAGRTPPFSALDTLRRADGDYTIRVGPHPHCAGTPIEPPAALAGLRQISIQPTDVATCIDWFAVDLFVDDQGHLRGVVLDLWEP